MNLVYLVNKRTFSCYRCVCDKSLCPAVRCSFGHVSVGFRPASNVPGSCCDVILCEKGKAEGRKNNQVNCIAKYLY